MHNNNDNINNNPQFIYIKPELLLFKLINNYNSLHTRIVELQQENTQLHVQVKKVAEEKEFLQDFYTEQMKKMVGETIDIARKNKNIKNKELFDENRRLKEVNSLLKKELDELKHTNSLTKRKNMDDDHETDEKIKKQRVDDNIKFNDFYKKLDKACFSGNSQQNKKNEEITQDVKHTIEFMVAITERNLINV